MTHRGSLTFLARQSLGTNTEAGRPNRKQPAPISLHSRPGGVPDPDRIVSARESILCDCYPRTLTVCTPMCMRRFGEVRDYLSSVNDTSDVNGDLPFFEQTLVEFVGSDGLGEVLMPSPVQYMKGCGMTPSSEPQVMRFLPP